MFFLSANNFFFFLSISIPFSCFVFNFLKLCDLARCKCICNHTHSKCRNQIKATKQNEDLRIVDVFFARSSNAVRLYFIFNLTLYFSRNIVILFVSFRLFYFHVLNQWVQVNLIVRLNCVDQFTHEKRMKSNNKIENENESNWSCRTAVIAPVNHSRN